MKQNIGCTDRTIRIIVGITLMALAFLGVVLLGAGWWLGWLGVILLVTGLFRFCPLYPLLGINTKKC